MDKPKPDRSNRFVWEPGDIEMISPPSDPEREQSPDDKTTDDLQPADEFKKRPVSNEDQS